MIGVKYPVSLAAVLIWIGFVCAISFMEAWIKFRAPGVSLSEGLSIGRLVFKALNRVEWVLLVIALLDILIRKGDLLLYSNWILIIPFAVLAAQTFWLLPSLDIRAEQIIAGQDVASSNLHLYFVIGEVVKVASLGLFTVKQLTGSGPV